MVARCIFVLIMYECRLAFCRATVYDIDIVLDKRKQEARNRSRRHKKDADTDLINDHDDALSSLIRQMKEAAEVLFSYPLTLSSS